MKLSIIIVNYHTKDFLASCLSTIYKAPPAYPFELIVVDNASGDGARKLLSDKFPKVRIIGNNRNVGFAKANNQGLSKAKGEYILFLNPDIIPQPEAIDKLVKFMMQQKDAGCVGGKLLNPDGSLQFSCRRFPTFFNVFSGRRSLLNKLFPNNRISKSFLLTDLDYNKVQKVDWVMGACIMARKEVLERMGGFDEDYFLFVEDVDFCYRLRKANLFTYYLPDAQFFHFRGVSTDRFWKKSLKEHNFGMYNFFVKHYRPIMPLRVILYIGLVFRILSIMGVKLLIKHNRNEI